MPSAVTEHIPLKQGLRPDIQIYRNRLRLPVTEHIPLKQGLRPYWTISLNLLIISHRAYSTKTRIETTVVIRRRFTIRCHRAYSTKTRIETSANIPFNVLYVCHRAYSTKTRIETCSLLWSSSWYWLVTEHIPLKQGLRHAIHQH